MILIDVCHVSKAYKYYTSKWIQLAEKLGLLSKDHHIKKWILKDISFIVNAGESIGVIGVNGAGKSTLLKLLAGTTRPTAGKVFIYGKVSALLELGIGFHPDFSGRRNVYTSGFMMGYSRKIITSLISDIEKFADIGEYIDRPVRVYSSGMQMRLAFAIATALRPDILIVDEALSVGDSFFQAKCFARIADFKRQGTALLLVSHNIVDIAKHCDRVILLKNGTIELDGKVCDVTNRYLDEIFKQISTQINTASVDNNTELKLDSHRDMFNNRIGYRAEEYRWGHGGAKIIDFDIQVENEHYPTTIDSDKEINFRFKVLFENNFNSVVPGILIKSLEGLFLYGTNSLLCSNGKELISVKAGEIKIFTFTFLMKLNQGDYLLSCGISAHDSYGETIPLDRRYDSIILHVNCKIKFCGLVNLTSTFKTI